MWFASISPETGKFDASITQAGEHRTIRARKDLRDWLKRVGLPYHSPHKFRHGHAVYALKMANDVSALKAISQNLMHSNLSITDGVYGILSEMDVRKQIATLGQNYVAGMHPDIGKFISLSEEINQIIKQLEKGK